VASARASGRHPFESRFYAAPLRGPKLTRVFRRFAQVGLCGLVLGSCGIAKLSAEETAAELNRSYPGPSWRCIKDDHGWDYSCGETWRTDAWLRREGIGVDVDSDSVTARTAP
jgi:hypothetical protein